jgi:hypothetical protein
MKEMDRRKFGTPGMKNRFEQIHCALQFLKLDGSKGNSIV